MYNVTHNVNAYTNNSDGSCYNFDQQVDDQIKRYNLFNGVCIAPTPTANETYNFSNITSYEWTTYDNNNNKKESKNATIVRDYNCGRAGEDACYCDSSITNTTDPNFSKYCCPYVNNCKRPNIDEGDNFVDRPFYTIFNSKGDLEVKGNFAMTGDSNYFLGDKTILKSLASGVIEIYKSFFNVYIKNNIQIAKNIIFKKNGNTIKMNKTEISPARNSKIILTKFDDNTATNTPTWLELSANNMNIIEFKNISSVTTKDGIYYLTDKTKKRLIAYDSHNLITAYTGAEDWGWTPEGIDIDNNDFLYITSSFDRYNMKYNIHITNPINNYIYNKNDHINITWNSINNANKYVITEILPNNTQGLSSTTTATAYNFIADKTGVFTYQVSAYLDAKELTNTYTTFTVVDNNEVPFRITSPKYGKIFTSNDNIVLKWDEYPGASYYRTNCSMNGNVFDQSITKYTDTKLIIPPESIAQNSEYICDIIAYNSDNIQLKTTVNQVLMYIKSTNNNLKLTDNIYKVKIDINSGQTNYWEKFFPSNNIYDFFKMKNYELLKEYYEDKNGDGVIDDQNAMSFNNPKGIFAYSSHLYIVDSGNNRIVILNKNINIDPKTILKLENEKSIHPETWKQEITNKIEATMNNYWNILDIGTNTLNNPNDIFIEDMDNIYITDTGNKRVLFKKNGIWYTFGENNFKWNPTNLYKIKDINLNIVKDILYVTDTDNGRIIKINIDDYISQGAIFNETYFIYGKLGHEKYEFTYPADIAYTNQDYFIIPDSTSNNGHSFTINNTKAPVITLYNSYNKLLTNSNYDNYEFNNEFNTNTYANQVKIDDFIGIKNSTTTTELIKWKKGVGISHCSNTCSDDWKFVDLTDNCGRSYHFSATCNGCNDMDRTCRDQWDWEVDSPTCTYRTVQFDIYTIGGDSCKMCPSTCCSTSCSEEGDCTTSCSPCEVACGYSYHQHPPTCITHTKNCRVGYAVTYDNYVTPNDKTPYSAITGWPYK